MASHFTFLSKNLWLIIKIYYLCFKECSRQTIVQCLTEELPLIPLFTLNEEETRLITNIEPFLKTDFYSKIEIVTKKLDVALLNAVDLDKLESLRDSCENFTCLLKTDLVYMGTDEEKEKQQGRALFDRQKLFSSIIRLISSIGLMSRKGMQINSEELTILSISNIQIDSNKTPVLKVIFFFI